MGSVTGKNPPAAPAGEEFLDISGVRSPSQIMLGVSLPVLAVFGILARTASGCYDRDKMAGVEKMIDMKFAQKNPEVLAAALKNRNSTLNVAEFTKLDERRRVILAEVEMLKSGLIESAIVLYTKSVRILHRVAA